MQEQGPRTPSPTPEVSAGEEKIFSSENSESPIMDHDGKTLASCRLDPNSPTPKPFRGYPETPYKNRTGLRGTHDPSAEIAERFPLDANFQKP
jgi:hypothetical protein